MCHHKYVNAKAGCSRVCTHIWQTCVLCCRAEADSPVELPPVRSACTPVAVQFTKLETDHLPARETREQEISSYKRKAKVSSIAHRWLASLFQVEVLLRSLPRGRSSRHMCHAVDLHCFAHLQQISLQFQAPSHVIMHYPLLYHCGQNTMLYIHTCLKSKPLWFCLLLFIPVRFCNTGDQGVRR